MVNAPVGGPVEICVVGNDPQLTERCKAIVSAMGVQNWNISESSAEEPPDAEVYIFDYRPDSRTGPFSPAVIGRSLFVVAPKDLDEFRQVLGPMRASILLRPVTAPALAPFLENCMRRHGSEFETAGSPSQGTDSTNPMDSEDLVDCLLHANLKLQEHDQYRANFLARGVHDFRAPLTALSGYCGLLIGQRLGSLNTDQIDMLRKMQRSIERVTRLSDEMFQLTAGQGTKSRFEFELSDVEAAIQQALHEVTPLAEEKQIRITVQVESPAQRLYLDAGKVEQVLVNLLENACRFTPKDGSIELSGYPVLWQGGSPSPSKRIAPENTAKSRVVTAYRIDVKDSGCGISQDRLGSIFEEYTSYEGGTDRAGAGLGLAISRMIVQAHEGTIWAESGPTGTQFSFVLPSIRLGDADRTQGAYPEMKTRSA